MDRVAFGQAWEKTTVLHPIVACGMLVLIVMMFRVSRRNAVWPFIIIACFVVPAQRIVVGGSIDFNMLRLMTVVAWVRLIVKKELKGFEFKKIDIAMIVFALYRVFIILANSVPGFVNRLGTAIDLLGMYFFFRAVIRDYDDIVATLRGFAYVGLVLSGFFLQEHFSHKNVFAMFGYVNDDSIERAGRIRCQGPYSHPILAGCFWAGLMPLMAAMWWRGRKAMIEGTIGMVAAAIIVLMCASSTPLAGIMFGTIAASLFPVRSLMWLVRWGALAALILVQILWDKPVYRLMAEANFIGGSTGYYRYQLVDAAVKNFSEWWLIGMSRSTAEWGAGLKDVTNNFLMMGVDGGIMLLLLFLIVIGFAFAYVGRACRKAPSRPDLIMAWMLGVSLFIHCVNFLSVTYFGQIIMVWALTLAMIGSMEPGKTAVRKKKKRVARRVQRDESHPAPRYARPAAQ